MHSIKNVLPSLTVIAVLIVIWHVGVSITHSVIFPTPWQVLTAACELAADGTLLYTSGLL